MLAFKLDRDKTGTRKDEDVMPDTVATLSTTLQGQIAAGPPQPLPAMAATMVSLYQALVTGVGAMLAARTSRRVGILNTSTGNQWNCLPPGVDSGAVSQNYLEVREVANLQGNLLTFASNITRLSDPGSILANIPSAVFIAWANALVAFAASYEAMELETLPA